jgi:pimeloyl-ACP methyl ester carboxylesterase
VSAERSFELRTADGVRLHALLAAPPAPYAVLVLCHGLTTSCDEHGAFPALRDLALDAGIAVARYDARGHGSSAGSNEQLRLAGLRQDVEQVLEMVDEQLGEELPIVPLGLSFGGAAAVHAASIHRCAGLALWYAVLDYQWNYGPDSPAPFTARMRAAHDPSSDPPWSAMPVLGTDWHFPAELMAELPEDRTFQEIAALTVPVLAYHGSRDTFVDATPIRRLAAERPNVSLRIAHGAGHGFLLWRRWILRRTVAFAVRCARPATAA